MVNMKNILSPTEFLIIAGLIGMGLAILYSTNPKKYKTDYEITLAIFKCAGAVYAGMKFVLDRDNFEFVIAFCTTVLGLLEGLPVLLVPFLEKKDKEV